MDGLTTRPFGVAVAVGATSGTAFGFGPEVLQIAIIVPFVIRPARGGSSFATAVACASTATLPAGLAAFDYTGSVPTSIVAWAVPAGVTGLAFGAALATPRAWRPLAVGIAIIAVSLPPLSSITLVSPLPIAGLLFPGFGLLGLALLVVLLGAFSVGRSSRIASVSVICLAAAATLTAYATPEPEVAKGRAGIVGVDTRRGQPDVGAMALLSGMWRREERLASDALDVPAVLWPESVYGEWTELTGAMLTTASATVIGGARRYVGEDAYVNTLVDGKTGEVLYAQRSPVPLPIGDRDRAVSVPVLGTSKRDRTNELHALLCIEVANPWLAIATFHAAGRDIVSAASDDGAADGVVLWAANLGWSRRSGLERRMHETASQWSRLFDVPLVTAINRAEAPDA